jgi:hypothetical protein
MQKSVGNPGDSCQDSMGVDVFKESLRIIFFFLLKLFLQITFIDEV